MTTNNIKYNIKTYCKNRYYTCMREVLIFTLLIQQEFLIGRVVPTGIKSILPVTFVTRYSKHS